MTEFVISVHNQPPPLTFLDETLDEDETPVHPNHLSFSIYKTKLSGVIHLMSLIGGFCLSAVAELRDHDKAEPLLLTAFIIVTVLLTSMAGFVIMLTAWILPYLTANEELDSMLLATGLIQRFTNHRLFHLEKEFKIIIQITWIMGSTGIGFLFLIDFILLTWIKFGNISTSSSYAGTTVFSPTLLMMIYFGIRFWKQLVKTHFQGPSETQNDEENDDLESVYTLNNIRRTRNVSVDSSNINWKLRKFSTVAFAGSITEIERINMSVITSTITSNNQNHSITNIEQPHHYQYQYSSPQLNPY